MTDDAWLHWPYTWKFAEDLLLGDYAQIEIADGGLVCKLTGWVSSREGQQVDLLFVDQDLNGQPHHLTVEPTTIFQVYLPEPTPDTTTPGIRTKTIGSR